jgi:hypothetical protein
MDAGSARTAGTGAGSPSLSCIRLYTHRVRARIVGAVIIFLVSWGLTTHGKYSATGDEPHYLMVSQSLRSDGDLDVANNYARGDGRFFGASDLQPELHARPSRLGTLLPVHDIGVPVVLLPAFIVATRLATLPSEDTLKRFRMNRGLFAYSLISLVIIAIVSIAAALTIGALEQQGVLPGTAAVIVVVAWLSPPVLSNSFLVFPEPFALLVTAWSILEWSRSPERWGWRESALVFALGALPWFHRKYAFYAVALLGLILWRRRHAIQALTIQARLGLTLLFIAGPVALGLVTLRAWGNLAGPLALERLPFSWTALGHGALGLLVDRENGLLWWAPVYALLPAAWWLRRFHLGLWILPAAAVIVPSAAHDQWWGGFSPAGRFIVPLIPIFCLAAVPLVRERTARYAAFTLLIPQLVITTYGWQHPRMFWPRGDGENRVLAALLGSVGRPDRWIPSLRTEADTVWLASAVVLLVVAMTNIALVWATPRVNMDDSAKGWRA